MAGLDSRIPMMGVGVKLDIPDPQEQEARALQIKQGRMKLSQLQNLQSALQNPGTFETDPSGGTRLSDVGRRSLLAADPQMTMRLDEQSQQRSIRQLEAGMKQLDFLGQVADTVTDERSYQRARTVLGTLMPGFAAKLPDRFNAAQVEQWKAMKTDTLEKLRIKHAELQIQKAERDLRDGDSADKAKAAIQQENKLRGELGDRLKRFDTIAGQYSRVMDAARDPSPAGDVALVFSFMKTMDPESTVMEGEKATAQNAASVPDWLRTKYNSVVAGESLSDTQRKDFADRAKRIYSTEKLRAQRLTKQFGDLAEKYGADRSRIAIDYSLPEEGGSTPIRVTDPTSDSIPTEQAGPLAAAAASSALPEGITEEDIATTLQNLAAKGKTGWTREKVIAWYRKSKEGR